MSRPARTWLIVSALTITIAGVGCGETTDSGDAWKVGDERRDGADDPSRPVEAQKLLFVRKNGRILGTTQFEGVEVETETHEFGAFERNTPTGRLLWPDEVTLRPVEGLEDFEGREVARGRGIESAGLVSGEISRRGERLVVDEPELMVCHTAELLDYNIKPRESDACAAIDGERIGVDGFDEVKSTTEVWEPDEIEVSLESTSSGLGKCSLTHPVGRHLNANVIQGTSTYELKHLAVRNFIYQDKGVEVDCRMNDGTVRSWEGEAVRGWIWTKRGDGSLPVYDLHVQFTLEGREVDIWFHNRSPRDEQHD